jgi:hypothetical protein
LPKPPIAKALGWDPGKPLRHSKCEWLLVFRAFDLLNPKCHDHHMEICHRWFFRTIVIPPHIVWCTSLLRPAAYWFRRETVEADNLANFYLPRYWVLRIITPGGGLPLSSRDAWVELFCIACIWNSLQAVQNRV